MLSNVRLVGVTEPYAHEIVDGLTIGDTTTKPELLVSYCARVSNPNNQANYKTAEKLLKYLVKNAHYSPFEMVNVVIEIQTPRDIARQILRHRSFSFQEFSQRYADPTQALGFVFREARLQDDKNRQNSIETADYDLWSEWQRHQNAVLDTVREAYEWATENGIAKEVARVVLPEGLTMSRMYMNGTLRSWIHYCDLRMGNGTQKEHQEVARKCWQLITSIFPSLLNILEKKSLEETAQ